MSDTVAGEVLESSEPLLKAVRLRGTGGIAAFLPDGKTILTTGGKGKGLLSWDAAAGKLLAEWPADPDGCLAVAVPPSAAAPPIVVSASAKGFTVWDSNERAAIGRIGQRSGGGPGLQVSADGRVLIADPYGSRLYDLGTRRQIRVVPEGVTGRVIAVAPDCKTLLELDAVTVRLWEGGRDKVAAQQVEDGVPPERLVLGDAARGRLLHEFPLSSPGIRSAAFSADGKALLILNGDTKLIVRDVKAGKELRRWDWARTNVFTGIAISPDGRRVAALDRLGHGTVWDVIGGGPLLTFSVKTFAYAPPAFSPDGRILAVCEMNGSVLVYHIPPRPAPSRLSAKKLDDLWELMLGRDDQAPAANRALFALADAPKQAVPFLKERLRPPPPADPAKVKKLIADLNSDEVAVRDAAFERLHKMGVAAAHAIRAALKDPPSAEVRVRLKVLLMAAEDSRTLRPGRAVRALEAIDSDESRRALAELAKQKGDPWLAGEANAALDRLLIPRADHK